VSGGAFGRLSLPPHPLLFELLYQPRLAADVETVLPHLLDIDAAHLVMLDHRGVLPHEVAAELLRVNRDLARRRVAGEQVLASDGPHRGLYLLYEQHFVERLGRERGGAAHVARSRNDINATVTRMRLRAELLDLLEDGTVMLGQLVAQAGRHAETLMSAFTHLQPAQPSTFGHYLAAVGAEELRAMEWLAATFELVNRSPMGAAAGAGTSFEVDRAEVAALLGFDEVIESAGDAVASRDYVAYVLSGAAILGVSLTRLALDLQTWASQAWGFLDWPDDLVSSSSIMPQKRNAFVLEDLRGLAIHPVGALVNSLLGMKNTPFSNSVEVSGEATAHLWSAMDAIRTAVRLAGLSLSHLVVKPEPMRAALDRSQAVMTSVANLLVARHGLAFRTAHQAVAQLIVELGEEATPAASMVRARLEEIVERAVGREVPLDDVEIAAALDPRRCVEAARHGGGPAPEETRRQLGDLSERLARLGARVAGRRRGLLAAAGRLARAVEAALAAVPG
jgi:argininosuccinate lyase